jgi:hypothetical protein
VELLHGLLDEDAEGQRRLRRALGQALLKVATVRVPVCPGSPRGLFTGTGGFGWF